MSNSQLDLDENILNFDSQYCWTSNVKNDTQLIHISELVLGAFIESTKYILQKHSKIDQKYWS